MTRDEYLKLRRSHDFGLILYKYALRSGKIKYDYLTFAAYFMSFNQHIGKILTNRILDKVLGELDKEFNITIIQQAPIGMRVDSPGVELKEIGFI